MTKICEELLDELHQRLDSLDIETGEGLHDGLTDLENYLEDAVIDWKVCGDFETVDGNICKMIANGADAYIKLLDDEELSDILPRLADFITGVKGLLWFVGKNL